MGNLVRIKAPNGMFTGKRPFTFNAGALSLPFNEGLSEPVSEDKAKAFITHFKGYSIVPIVEEASGKSDDETKGKGKK